MWKNCAAASFFLAMISAQSGAASPAITEYAATRPLNAWRIDNNSVWGITPGADGNLWFVESGSVVASLSPTGSLREFLIDSAGIPDGERLSGSIVSTPDGKLWVPTIGCDICQPQTASYLLGVSTAGAFVSNVLLDFRTIPGSLTFGPNDAFWIAEAPSIGTVPDVFEVSPASGGGLSFPLPNPMARVRGITTGPDGNLWLTENTVVCPNGLCSGANARIGRLQPSRALTEFPVPSSDSFLGDIVAGPDGNLWFTESQGNDHTPAGGKVGRITPAGDVVEFALPTVGGVPVGIAKGADGNLWFTEHNANQIGRITPSGAVNEYMLPNADSGPLGITAGPDGNIWFTEDKAGKIGKLELVAPPVVLDGYLSGNWYDPAQAGQGFQLEFTDQGSTALAIWFTFAPGGGQQWIYAQGTYDRTRSTVVLPAVVSSGTMFPPHFNSADVVNTPWGTLSFTFTSCNSGTATWSSTLPAFGVGSMPIVRLTSIRGQACP